MSSSSTSRTAFLSSPTCSPSIRASADISGPNAPGPPQVTRERSWPVVSANNYERPDTLGWTRDPLTGNAIPSMHANRDRVWQIYDLLPTEMVRTASQFHRYSIEVTTGP